MAGMASHKLTDNKPWRQC